MADNQPEVTPESNPDPLFLVDDETRKFFEDYVGPGKKYANVGELAKGYANADTHLGEITRDAGIFKTEAEQLKEMLMENLVKNNEPKPNENEPITPPNEQQPPAPPPEAAPPKESGEVDIKALVKEALGEVSSEEKRVTNSKLTEEATLKHFGDKEAAIKAIQAKADELGVSPQWIANQAFDSPKAYFTIMGFQPDVSPKSNNTPAPHSDVNPVVMQNSNTAAKPNSYRWFMELRKSDPGKFRSQAVQQAILKAAQENPDFYK